MTGDTIRREDLIEWSGLPVGKTCALCGNSPGPGRVKWWKEADKPGSARWVCGACYADLNGSAVEAMPPTPAATPEAVRQADDEAPGPVTPGRGDTRPTPTSSVTVPLIEGIEMEIAAAPGGGWVTRFTRNGDTLTEDRSGAEPWIDKRATGRLTKALAEAVPTLKEKAIKEAITAVFDGIRGSPDGKALVSEPAARVIGATKAVTVEMCDPPVYRVELIDGAILTFSNRDMAALQPVTPVVGVIGPHHPGRSPSGRLSRPPPA